MTKYVEWPEFAEPDAYIDRVIRDGRYIKSFQDDPQQIAGELGMELSPETVSRIVSGDRGELLQSLYDAQFNRQTSGTHPYILHESETAGIGFIIAGTAIGIGIVALAVLSSIASDPAVTDKSSGDNDKL